MPNVGQSPNTPTITPVRLTGLFLGPIIFVLLLLMPAPGDMPAEAWKVAALASLIIIWWVTEAIPLPATALLPALLMPALDIIPIRAATAPYASPAIFLFLGGFIIAAGMEKWDLHKRIALTIVSFTGSKPHHILLGFMCAGAFLSMWISNTATMLMMLPLALSVIHLINRHSTQGQEAQVAGFSTAMMLGMAYACSIGGVGTLIGTPPNAILKGFMQTTYGYDMDFLQWMYVGIPVVVIMIATLWLLFSYVLFPILNLHTEEADEVVKKELKSLGKMSSAEKRVGVIFFIVAFLWMFSGLLKPYIPFAINDTGVAIFGALLLFLTPAGKAHKGHFLLRWKEAERIPWGVLILFGGGLSLAAGFQSSGLAQWIGGSVSELGNVSLVMLIILMLLLTMLCTELISNVATVTIFLPVIGATMIGFGENPLYALIPATIGASMAFMLPVATANNAIVFGSGHVKIGQMVKAGIGLKIFAMVLVSLLTFVLFDFVFDLQPQTVPEWAQNS